MSRRPVVISGPSGVGKSTLLTKLFNDFGDVLAFSVSHTTRNPRPGETDGREYHFVTKDTFEEMLRRKEFLEYARFSGNYYGTSQKEVEDIAKSNRICVLDLEINGVKSIRSSHLDARFIFISAPSLESIRARLQSRGTESSETLQKRLDTAIESIEYANKPGSYDHVIVNDEVEIAYNKLLNILKPDMVELRKEKGRTTGHERSTRV